MGDFEQVEAAVAALKDPGTTPEDLLAITTAQPTLWAQIASHPNIYPELLDYLGQYGDEEVQAAVAARDSGAVEPLFPVPLDETAALTVETTIPRVEATVPMTAPTVETTVPDPAKTLPLPPIKAVPLITLSMSSPSDPEPPVANPPEATPPVTTTPASTSKRHPRRTLFIVLGSIVVVLGVAVALFFLVIQPRLNGGDQVKEDFATAVTTYEQAQTSLTQKLAEAEKVQAIDAVPADPTLTDALSDAITAAQEKVSAAPAMAQDSGQIKDQIDELTRESHECDDAVLALDQAMTSLTDSRILYAQDSLNGAIAAAQAVLNQSQGLADDEAPRSALATAIQRVQTIVNTLPTADPATFATTITEQTEVLQQASQAVIQATEAHTITCGNGVALPAGIHPMVCEGMPATAQQPKVTVNGTTYTQFSMPSGNVGCTKDAYGAAVVCEILRKDWTLPAEITPACGASDSDCEAPEVAIKDGVVTSVRPSNTAPWASNKNTAGVTIPVLEYGQVANLAPVACLSDANGVICWDTTTHHGFQISVTAFTSW